MNAKMNILKAIGIIFVVCGHAGASLFSVFPQAFPAFTAYSFHMALFVFISGYFYKPENELNCFNSLLHKFKKLIIPYFLWNLFYGIITDSLLRFGRISFGQKLTLNSLLIEPFITGHQFIFNLPAWFIIVLFSVYLIYLLSRQLIAISLKGKNLFWIYNFLYLILGIAGVILAQKGYNKSYWLIFNRICFALPFFHLGYLYKIKLEKFDLKPGVYKFLIIFFIQTILILAQNGNTDNLAYTMAFMTFKNPNAPFFMPFLSSLTGIYLCLQVAIILEKSFSQDYILNILGKNTFSIMMHHIFCFFLVNVLYLNLKNNGLCCGGFDTAAFKINIWYKYIFQGSWSLNLLSMDVYILAGLFIPILIEQSFKKLSLKSAKSQKS